MSLQRNYYEVLGLPPGATTDQIKKKYRELARKFHPDVVQDKVLGQRVFTQINQAYSVLGNPERRAQYNSSLQGGAANGTASADSASKPNASQTAAAQAASDKIAPTAPAKPVSPVQAQASAEMLGRAENAIMAGKPVEARTLCVRILENDPRHVRALEILGDALVQMGKREDAAAQYRKALTIAPSTMIQAKLNRLTTPPVSARTTPPPSAPPPRNGTGNGAMNGGKQTVVPTNTATEETEKPGGLLGRLLGRK